VRWELTADVSGTQVTHRGLANEEAARKDYTGGWPDALEMFSNFIEKSGKDKRDSCMWISNRREAVVGKPESQGRKMERSCG
jgi:hypothetical protein